MGDPERMVSSGEDGDEEIPPAAESKLHGAVTGGVPAPSPRAPAAATCGDSTPVRDSRFGAPRNVNGAEHESFDS